MLALLIARLPLLLHRRFDPDELEHAHTAWCWSRGLLPYRDFFEHHTPWYYVALRPLFSTPFSGGLDVAGSLAGATRFLLLARCLSLVLTVIALGLVVAIGRLWAERRVGLLAALLLLGQFVFLQKTVEARPDVPALVFYLAAVALLLRGARAADGAPGNRLLSFPARSPAWASGRSRPGGKRRGGACSQRWRSRPRPCFPASSPGRRSRARAPAATSSPATSC
jgi:hypothetical protein